MLIDSIKSKEIGISEVLKIGANIYSDGIKTVIYVLALILVPVNFVVPIIEEIMLGSAKGLDLSQIMDTINNPELIDGFFESSLYNRSLLYMIILWIINISIITMGHAAIMRMTKESAYGIKTNYKNAILEGLLKAPSLFTVGVLLEVGVFLAIFVCAYALQWLAMIIPSLEDLFILFMYLILIIPVVISVYLYFVTQAVMLDDKKPIEAIKFSIKNVSGKGFKTFLFTLAFLLVQNMASFIIDVIFINLGNDIYAVEVLKTCILGFVELYVVVCITVLYLNRISTYVPKDTHQD